MFARRQDRGSFPRDLAESRASKHPFGMWIEANLAHEEWQLDMHIVLGLDADVSTIALHGDFPRGFWKTERIGALTEVADNECIAVVGGEPHLLAHGILVLV